LAWYPRVFCKLSFGTSDNLAVEVDRMPWIDVRGSWIQAEGEEWMRLRAAVKERVPTESLMRYVPFRLIRPFFYRETQGIKGDVEINRKVEELASTKFETTKPLYQFTSDRKGIYFQNDWALYLDANLEILDGWCKFKLARYLQDRNPGVVGILDKMIPPTERSTLTPQTKYWRHYLGQCAAPPKSIYTQRELSTKQFSLDHFMPWSFVAHDRIWNLIPEENSVNSAKSDCLPSDRYLRPFAEIHFDALVSTRDTFPAWSSIWATYQDDFGFSTAFLTDKPKFLAGFVEALSRQLTTATRQGFRPGWIYQPKTG